MNSKKARKLRREVRKFFTATAGVKDFLKNKKTGDNGQVVCCGWKKYYHDSKKILERGEKHV